MSIRTEIALNVSGTPLSHYTDAVRFGDLLFISGIVALDSEGRLVAEGDVIGQTEYVLSAIEKILAHEGGSFADVLRVTVYLRDIGDRTRINPVRQKYFGQTRPASTLIEVSALAVPGLLVEIEAVAGLRPAATGG